MDRRIRIGVGLLLAFPVVWLGTLNLFLNFGLSRLPGWGSERLSIDYDLAWSVFPGRVHVHGLRIRSLGEADRWQLEARHVSGRIDLYGLRDRCFRASGVTGEGVRIRYRLGADPSLPERKGSPWNVALSDLRLSLRELWIEDYRYAGRSRLEGSLRLDAAEADALLGWTLSDGSVALGEEPMADELHGTLALKIDRLPRQAGLGREAFRSVSGAAALEADVRDLSFFHYYLSHAPWLTVGGAGALRMDVTLDSGRFREGSWLSAETRDLSVGFLSYDIRGDGVVRLEATELLELPTSRLAVDFGAFTIREGAEPPLVEGTGLSVDAVSPDLSLAEPFTSLDVVMELPESELRNIHLYNAFLPEDIGFSLTGGTGRVRGRLTASTLTNVAEGDVWLEGDDLEGRLDDLWITLDLSLHARLSEGRLGEGLYDFSGTRLQLRNVGLVDRVPTGREHDESRSWWARVEVPSGEVRIGKPIYLDAAVTLQCADSVPFVRVLTQRKELAGWIQGLLSISDLSGGGRVRLGADTVELDGFSITGGSYEVRMRWLRQRRTNRGAVFARYGRLSVGVGIEGDAQEIHVFDARDWFERRSAQAPARREPEERPSRREAREHRRRLAKQARAD